MAVSIENNDLCCNMDLKKGNNLAKRFHQSFLEALEAGDPVVNHASQAVLVSKSALPDLVPPVDLFFIIYYLFCFIFTLAFLLLF